MKGRWQAMLVASTLALLSLLITPVSILSSATISLVTLRRGATEGLIVLACSSLVAAILGIFLMGNFQFALVYAGVLWLPIWLVSVVLREGRNLSLAIESAVLLGVLSVVGFYLYQGDPATMWRGLLTQMIPADAPVVDIQDRMTMLSHYMTGGIVAGSVFSLLFSLLLARWWQARLYNPEGFKPEFLSLNTPPRLAMVSLVILGLGLITTGIISEIAWNITISAVVLYGFIGTAVLHAILSSRQLSRYVIWMFYITLFLIPHLLIPVAVIGVSDAWLNWRKRFSKI